MDWAGFAEAIEEQAQGFPFSHRQMRPLVQEEIVSVCEHGRKPYGTAISAQKEYTKRTGKRAKFSDVERCSRCGKWFVKGGH